MSSLAPELFLKKIVDSLTNEKRSAHGQVATVDDKGLPQIRTVHFRYLNETGQIAFAANTKSPKWRQLGRKPIVAGCLYDSDQAIQFRWEASVKLIHEKSIGPEQRIRKKLWALVRPDVRSAYWLDYKGFPAEKLAGSKWDPRRSAWGQKAVDLIGNQLLKNPCPTFGVVVCTPHLWDIMEIDTKDYRADRRTLHRFINNSWVSRRLSVLHSKDFGGL